MTPEEMWPESTKLGLTPVERHVEGTEHRTALTFVGSYPAFDVDEVEKALGPVRFEALNKGLKRVLSCRHRIWPSDHPIPTRRNCEVHAVFADDLESFLTAEKAEEASHAATPDQP